MGRDNAATFDRLRINVRSCRAMTEELKPKPITLIYLLDMVALEIDEMSVEGKRAVDQTAS